VVQRLVSPEGPSPSMRQWFDARAATACSHGRIVGRQVILKVTPSYLREPVDEAGSPAPTKNVTWTALKRGTAGIPHQGAASVLEYHEKLAFIQV